MSRKQFKRNIQAQRQRRSVTYMNDSAAKRKNLNGNIAAGAAMGSFVVLIIFKGYGVF